ncbi:MAG: hypothetical protein K6E99_04525 [Bacilli bacterium]|nr:hypothetical protein [Bacilli bacterium]
MKRSTKKKVVREVEHKGLKLFGALINLFGMALYAVYNVKVVLASLVLVRNEFPNKTFDEVLNLVTKSALLETGVIFGTIVVFEFINYYLYLNKKRDVLLGFIAFEVMAFMVAAYMFGFTYIFSYVVLLPAITGFINYYILVNEGE